MIRCCIFDLDGTLLNTIDDLAASCNHALAQYGYPGHPVESYQHFVGNGVSNLVERALPEGVPEEGRHAVLEAFSAHYSAHFMDLTAPYDGIEALLLVLRLKDIKTCVVTNKPHQISKELLESVFGRKYFEMIVGAGDDLPKKPAPDGVLRCMNKLAVAPNECVYIGDSDVDVFTAKNAGILSIGAQWGFRGSAELAAAGADYIAVHPKDILSYIEKIQNPA